MPMQPRPRAETSSFPLPSVRVFIVARPYRIAAGSSHAGLLDLWRSCAKARFGFAGRAALAVNRWPSP